MRLQVVVQFYFVDLFYNKINNVIISLKYSIWTVQLHGILKPRDDAIDRFAVKYSELLKIMDLIDRKIFPSGEGVSFTDSTNGSEIGEFAFSKSVLIHGRFNM